MEVTAPTRISRDPRGAPPHAQPQGASMERGGALGAVTRVGRRGGGVCRALLVLGLPPSRVIFPGRLSPFHAGLALLRPRRYGVKNRLEISTRDAHLHGREMGAQPSHKDVGDRHAAWRDLRKAPGCVDLVDTLPARPSRGNPLLGCSGRGDPFHATPHRLRLLASRGAAGSPLPLPARGAETGRGRVGLLRQGRLRPQGFWVCRTVHLRAEGIRPSTPGPLQNEKLFAKKQSKRVPYVH